MGFFCAIAMVVKAIKEERPILVKVGRIYTIYAD
jgi:hypothetical protein